MLDSSLTRRSFFKIAAATAGATLVASEAASTLLESSNPAYADAADDVKVIHSTCRGCGKMECGNLVTVRNGRVVHIEGDHRAVASRGNLCVKGRAAVQALYHPDRIRYPLIRTTPKGQDPKWRRVSHDEAIRVHGRRPEQRHREYGQHAIKTLHGTGRITTYATEAYPTYLLQTANTGSPAGVICKGPRLSAAAMICFPGAHWCNLIDGQKVNFQWGTNQEVSNYDNSCRVTVDEHVKAETTICVGPRMQNLGKEADIWLDLRPGTDDAIALGLLHQCVFNSNCHPDMMFVKKWTNAPFLYCEDIEPSGWTWAGWGDPEGKQEMGSYPLNVRTRIPEGVRPGRGRRRPQDGLLGHQVELAAVLRHEEVPVAGPDRVPVPRPRQGLRGVQGRHPVEGPGLPGRHRPGARGQLRGGAQGRPQGQGRARLGDVQASSEAVG